MSRVLLDQNVPKRLRSFLGSHSVETAYEREWSSLANGELLRAVVDAGFDVFVTGDQNLRFQQNLAARTFGTVVLGSNLWPTLASDSARILAAVEAAAGHRMIVALEYSRLRRP